MICNAISIFKIVNSDETDSVISYLPLAHMFERIVQITMMISGGSSFFYRGDTLLLLEDIALAKPTIFVGVPRLYNKVYDKIIAQVEDGGFVKKSDLNQGHLTSIFDFIFTKVRNALGGKVKLLV